MDVQVIVFWSRVVAGALAGVGLLLMVWGAARWRPGREKKFCPGVRVRGVRRWSPLRIAWPRACGYDLSGLPVDAAGAVICPECGRQLWAASGALRSAARWRPGRLGVALTVMAAVVVCAPMLKTRQWQRHVPTTVLIGLKRAVGTEWMPTRLRREAGRRLDRGGLYGWQVRWVIPGLQRDLRADDFSRNAMAATWHLRQMGKPGFEALERSLSSRDLQERLLAADELRQRCWVRTWKGRELVSEPSEALLRVSAEGLAGSGLYDVKGEYEYRPFGFLLQFPERAAPLVEKGLYSDDGRQLLACASLAMQLRRTELYPRAVPVLTSHLADNSLRRDAVFAAATLALLKGEAVPILKQLRASGDLQQRTVAELLLERMEPGGRGWADERLAAALDSNYWASEVWSWMTMSDLRWVDE